MRPISSHWFPQVTAAPGLPFKTEAVTTERPSGRASSVDVKQGVSDPLLRVEELCVSFEGVGLAVDAVRGVSFEISQGEVFAIVGESGSGKSVTARALVGLAGNRARVEAKRLALAGRNGVPVDLHSLSPEAWRRLRGREIGFVLQDALSSLDPLRKIGREVAEPIFAHGILHRAEIPERVKELLVEVGIADPKHVIAQYPHELSGGLRQRALIASALAGEPRLLIADEPTTALDVSLQQQVLSVFSGLARAGHAVLLITHDLAVVAQVAARIAVMQKGQIVETGTARDVLFAPRHEYTKRLLGAVPSAATRGRRLASPPGEKLVNVHQASLDPRAKPIIEARSVSLAFTRPDGSRHDAVRDVSLKLYPGETLGIVGESGSGKTTLGKLVLALAKPHRGEVLLKGEEWSAAREKSRRVRRSIIQTITQDPFGSFDPRFDVAGIIEQPLRVSTTLDRAARRRRIASLLQMVGLEQSLSSRRGSELSGGQRQRVAIAQALASEPEVLVCDEPVSALDVTTQAQVLDLLSDLQRRLGLAMIFVSHDLRVVQHLCHRIAVMKDGRIVETGTVEEIFETPKASYTQELLAALPQLPTR
ncbi:dipeptide/oligopeptide ABC transporter ATP-binding protein (plasmid) [Rhizobium gallicum bv. gallicum R602sp]|uniref:Dipeptide/oligopeptide ABC transporter ATP-binding protein n=1 Tax=Rhizobium gallicum bv. gallicum R602sp TaxID=1041138 RepID=A0A0B4XCB6_9HYPH|nr:ABC transporter ATP-binding protein [Rhizobium gallicum]AJD44228.1 dipeptide/oligopeptide ABC transporter ATP-binding protein [Rhizobium gallicum bv. gallicum R602sp]